MSGHASRSGSIPPRVVSLRADTRNAAESGSRRLTPFTSSSGLHREIMDETTIRPATLEDRAALGRYGGALMRQHHAFDPQRFLSSDHPEAGYGRFLVSPLQDPDCVGPFAQRGGGTGGYAYAGPEPVGWEGRAGGG